MKLYYSPGACSLASHILLNEVGASHQEVAVDLKTKKTEDGKDFTAINPKGYVPTLEIEKGKVLTENAIILQYIADQNPEAQLIAKAGSWERTRQLEMVNFIATEIHKGFGPLFDPTTPEDLKVKIKKKLQQRLSYVNEQMEGKAFVMGATYTIADPYLFTMLTWARHHGVDVSGCSHLQAQYETVRNRSATELTLKAEKLNNKL